MAEEKELQENKKEIKKVIQVPLKEIIALIVVIAIIVGVVIILKVTKKEPKKEIITESSLREIINISELSTHETVYNGVAKAVDSDGDILYYVSYDARVEAGFDFEQLEISVEAVEEGPNKIIVTIPDIEITDITVDIESMDYIFIEDKANTGTVSQEAYKLCIADVEAESASQDAIFKLAEQNARNVVEALVKPFIEQQDEEYILEVK